MMRAIVFFGWMYAFTESVSSDGWPLRGDRHLKLLCFVVRGNGGDRVFGKAPKALYRGDAMVFVLFVYLLIHASLTHAMQSREFYLSISYFGLYVVFR